MPGHAAASRFSASTSNLPSGSCAITAFGMPFSRMSAVSARVSMPVMAMMPRALSHTSRCWLARQLDGAVIEARSTQPRTPPAARLAEFHVLVVGADIADMREGEGDDLSGIRRIGEDLLIAGHRRVEADLADRDAGRARAPSFDDGAVGQDEEGGRRLVGPIGQRAHARRCGLLGQSVGAIVHGSWVAVAGGRLLGRVRVTQHQELRGTGPAGHADSYVRGARRSIHSGKDFPVKTMD